MGLFAGEAAVLLSTGRSPSLPDNCPKWGRWRRVGRVLVRFSPPPPKARGVVAAAGRRIVVEKLWRELFSDPSQWWDNRLEKENARYPDFTHKKRGVVLWLDGHSKPPWVEAELAAMLPGTIQPNLFTWNRRLGRHVKAGEYEKVMEGF